MSKLLRPFSCLLRPFHVYLDPFHVYYVHPTGSVGNASPPEKPVTVVTGGVMACFY